MWNLPKKQKIHNACTNLLDVLENAADVAALSASQREHLAACADCQELADAIFIGRSVLREVPPAAPPGPWFAPRVMAAIGARDAELRQSMDTWAAVPRLAQRLTWVSALALLLASTWLYQTPRHSQSAANKNQGAFESLFDASQSPTPDDVLPTMESGHD
jgi:hypothetical protein